MAPFERVWLEGWFDLFHYGHSLALYQSHQIGNQVIVGLCKKEKICKRGAEVLNISERCAAIQANRWCSQVIVVDAPCPSIDCLDKYDCQVAICGDDVKIDEQKLLMDKLVQIKKTRSISSTDIVSRVILKTSNHLENPLLDTSEFLNHLGNLCSDSESMRVFDYTAQELKKLIAPSSGKKLTGIFINGDWDLFHAGHIQILQHLKSTFRFVIVGIRNDACINRCKGLNRPILNIQERALAIAGCKYVDAMVLNTPDCIDNFFFKAFEKQFVLEAYCSKKTIDLDMNERYYIPISLGKFIPLEPLQLCVSTSEIIDRINRLAKHIDKTQISANSTQICNNVDGSKGKIIVFEGLDRSGKTSILKNISDRFLKRDIQYLLLNFPDRSTYTGRIIDKYLKGIIPLEDHAIHLLFSANRWENVYKITEAVESGKVVLIDRYIYSGIAYSSSKGLDWDWCKNCERGLPTPDAVIFLQVSDTTQQQRGGFGAEKYEKKILQQSVRLKYNQLIFESAKDGLIWNIVDANQSKKDTVKDVLKILKELCNFAKPENFNVDD